MSLRWLLMGFAACSLAASAQPITYDLGFTGGVFLNSGFVPFAPTGGSFTYDSQSGFSNFDVTFDNDTFDFTSSANASAAQTFGALVAANPGQWTALGNSLFQPSESTLNLMSGGISLSATAAPFPGFDATKPISGTFTVAETPEPSSAMMLAGAAGLFTFAGLYRRRGLKRAS